jgi:DNA-binding CsgD family transcriptional regulator
MCIRTDQPVTCPEVIGRAIELASLERVLRDGMRGVGGVVLLSGEAGIGKTRLIATAKASASHAGYVVLESSCFEPDSMVPYAPLIDLFRELLLDSNSSAVAQVLDSAAPGLVRMVPELSVRVPGLVRSTPLEPDQERHSLFHTVYRFLLDLTRAQPVLLIIEDLHWCDDTTLDLLLYIARRLAAVPLLLLLSYRSEEPQPNLRHLLAELDRQRLAAEVSLGPLDRTGVDGMLRAMVSPHRPATSGFLDDIYALTEGNPFFVEEVLKALVVTGDLAQVASGGPDRTPLDALRIPRTIEDALLRRLGRASPAAQRVARLAAVAGRRFEFSLLAALAGVTESTLLRQLDELIGAQLLVEESTERFAFRHALTRQAIYAQLLARERQLLHQAFLGTIERLYGERLDTHLADLAYHAHQAGDWPKTLRYAERMGDRALAMGAPRAAAEHFTHALEAADHMGQAPSVALFRVRGQAYEVLGEFVHAQADYSHTLEVSRLSRDQQAEWQSLLDLGFLWLARDLEQAGRFFHQALDLAEAGGDVAQIAHSRNRLGNWHLNMDQPGRSVDLHRQALATFEALGDRSGVAQSLDLLAVATYVTGDRGGAIAAFERAADQFRLLEDRRGLASVLATLAHLRCASHVYDTLTGAAAPSERALVESEEALRIARAIGWRSGEAYADCEVAACASAEGLYSRALAAASEGQAIAEELEHRGWLAVAHATRGLLDLDLLDGLAARRHFEHGVEHARSGGSVHLRGIAAALLALAHLLDGDTSQAETVLLQELDPEAQVETLTQSLLLAAYAEVRLAQGAAARALDIADRLTVWAAAHGDSAVVPRLSGLRGEALAAMGHAAEAEVALRAAIEAAQHQRARPCLWRLHLALGRLLHTRGRRHEAQGEYAAARSVVDELSATIPDQAQRDTFRDRALSRLPAVRALTPQRTMQQAYGGLTARERMVAALIGQGLSNAQIAERLVVSVRTVESHTGHIRDKLHLTSRAQVATWAVAGGLAQTVA